MKNYIAIKTLLESIERKNLSENHRKTCTGNKMNKPTFINQSGQCADPNIKNN
jgi:hypothetical protein